MKYTLIILLLVCNIITVSAQKHRFFTDVGVHAPGFSLTYNYKFAKYFSTGLGVQGYNFYAVKNTRMFTPAVYADIRLNIRPEKNNQFFSFMDMGMDIYKLDKNYQRNTIGVSYTPNNGFYTGLGFGYFRRISERGWGPYASVKLMSNWHTTYGYSLVSEEEDLALLVANGAVAFSLGFKF